MGLLGSFEKRGKSHCPIPKNQKIISLKWLTMQNKHKYLFFSFGCTNQQGGRVLLGIKVLQRTVRRRQYSLARIKM